MFLLDLTYPVLFGLILSVWKEAAGAGTLLGLWTAVLLRSCLRGLLQVSGGLSVLRAGLGDLLMGEMGPSEGPAAVSSLICVGRISPSRDRLGDLGRKSVFLSLGQGRARYFLIMISPLIAGSISASKVSLVLGIVTATKQRTQSVPGTFKLVIIVGDVGFLLPDTGTGGTSLPQHASFLVTKGHNATSERYHRTLVDHPVISVIILCLKDSVILSDWQAFGYLIVLSSFNSHAS